MKNAILMAGLIILASCSGTQNTTRSSSENSDKSGDLVIALPTEVSTDPTYGYSEDNAIEVGGGFDEGVNNQHRYLRSLAGPRGERVSYYRLGSCCARPSEQSSSGTALLDIYKVTWAGSSDTATLYINLYDSDKLKAPKGFTLR